MTNPNETPIVLLISHGEPHPTIASDIAGKTIRRAAVTQGRHSIVITFTDGSSLQILATTAGATLLDDLARAQRHNGATP
jgi:hypothetical protein